MKKIVYKHKYLNRMKIISVIYYYEYKGNDA